MLIQIHLLQNYSPANLNRDDTGSPKDALFGGVRRGRISSQCLKRSMRKSAAFVDAFADENLLATRTKLLPELVRKELEQIGIPSETAQIVISRISDVIKGSKKDEKSEDADEETQITESSESEGEKTKQLVFIAPNETRPFAENLWRIYQEYGDAKKWAKADAKNIVKALGASVPRSVDVAMFGRMTTSEAFEDMQAAVQVAHALSTNALAEEFDYYTAVDDITKESGAGMIGDIEYNCSTYYKYINVHWEQLVNNLGDDVAVARRAVLALVQAAATAQPTGKQNTFAAHCLPDVVLVEVREKNLPVNYANAFIKPARQGYEQTVMDDSVAKLADYLTRVGRAYGLTADKRALVAIQDYTLPGAEVRASLEDLQAWLEQQLPEG
ncbi:MAG: type I-E CRISPR-associated protein Cas7/Cse4/CasC [Anaerolineae bacterium]|nr:type I-E CRISPR-associated protein Cas7/Cse4/CasC [Anaerolineae bacterium]